MVRYFLLVVVLLTVTMLWKSVSGECANNCEWTSWFNWDCSRCCTTGRRFAIRQRGICCHNSTNPLVCLGRCNKQQIDMQETDNCPPHCDACVTTTSKTAPVTKKPAGIYSPQTNQLTNQMSHPSTAISTSIPKTSVGQAMTKTTANSDCQMTVWSNWVCSYCCQPQHIAVRQRGISCRNTNNPLECLQQCGKQRTDIQETGSCSSHCGRCPSTTSSTLTTKSTSILKTTRATTTNVNQRTSSQPVSPMNIKHVWNDLASTSAPSSNSARVNQATLSHPVSVVNKIHVTKSYTSSVTPITQTKIRSTQASASKTTSMAQRFTSLLSKHDTTIHLTPIKGLQTKPNTPKHSITNKLFMSATVTSNPRSQTLLSTNSGSSPKALPTSKTKPSTVSPAKGRSQPNSSSTAALAGNSLSPMPPAKLPDNISIPNQLLPKTTSGSSTLTSGATRRSSSTNPMHQNGNHDSLDSVGSALSDGFPSIATIISSALADTGSNNTEECRLECAGKDTWDTCLKECFNRPCNNMLMLVSPCLFVLGVIVGTTITCIFRSLVSKLKKKKRAVEENSVLPFKEYLND